MAKPRMPITAAIYRAFGRPVYVVITLALWTLVFAAAYGAAKLIG